MTTWIVICAAGDGYSAHPFPSRQKALDAACAMLRRGIEVIRLTGGGAVIEADAIRAICKGEKPRQAAALIDG